MTADIQTLSFITHKLERLPLRDALASENLPKLFCWRGINGLDEIYPRGLKADFVASSTPHRSETPSELSNWNSEEENVHSLLKRARVECKESFCLAEPCSDIVLSKFLPVKKKKPSEETSQENISVVADDDDEVSSLCHSESRVEISKERDSLSRHCFVGVQERSLFKPVARRPRSRPSVGLAEMKAKSMWRGNSPYLIDTDQPQREVKVVRVAQSSADDRLAVPRKDYCFRPIVHSGVFEALDAAGITSRE